MFCKDKYCLLGLIAVNSTCYDCICYILTTASIGTFHHRSVPPTTFLPRTL